VSKGVEDGHRLLALQAGHPRKSWKAVLGVAHPQGIEELGMAGRGKTLGTQKYLNFAFDLKLFLANIGVEYCGV
jgi:hypothetical protein